MKIKLLKTARWGTEKGRKGSTYDVEDRIGLKLINRGYAEEYVEGSEAEKEDEGE